MGPISVVGLSSRYFPTRTMSITGMPSVMQATRGTPASADSRMASTAKAAGTKMRPTFAPVSATASLMELKTGAFSSHVVPPLPGVTPATRLVPYSMQRRAWKVPSLPVIPCTRRRVFSSTRMLTGTSLLTLW